VAAAAPATYLIETFDADEASATGKVLTAMAIYSWSNLYGEPASNLVAADAQNAYKTIAHDCLNTVPNLLDIFLTERQLEKKQFLKANPAKTPPWEDIMKRNSPGLWPAGAPVFLAQGTADTIVRPYVTKRFGKTLCKQGARVMYVKMPGVTHGLAAKKSVSTVLQWMDARFRGEPAPSVCGR
jgi:hypothetical protein